MCGIAGVIGPVPPETHRIEATLAALAHRGPDARSHIVRPLGDMTVSLLHSRLAIIDCNASANQPFCRDGVALIFNGEIYNYLELRQELELRGWKFRTRSDTEVLLVSYLQWGKDCLDRFEGMWAFALLDERKNGLFISRDRFGEKPLFYMHTADGLYFASEVKALAVLAGIKPDVNFNQVSRFLTNGFRFLHKGDATFFENVSEIPKATFAWLRDAGPPTAKPYWKLEYIPKEMTRAEALAGVKDKLFSALDIRLRADVPLSFCLSGGVDSCSLAAIASKIFGREVHGFSVIDTDPRYDERDNIRVMVDHLDCRLTEVFPSRDGFLDRMERLIADHCAPIATINYFLHASLSEAISDAGFKVAVSGTGADEIFTGYYDHYAMWLAGMASSAQSDPSIDMQSLIDDWKSGYGAAVRNPVLRDPLVFLADPARRDHILLNRELFTGMLKTPFQEDWWEKDFTPELLRNRMLNELFHEIVPVILAADDLNSMRVSVENRSPFLDRKLAEFMFTVPSQHLVANGMAKSLLRQSMADIVPDAIRLDKRKRGFNAAIESLVDLDDPETKARLLDPGPIFEIVCRDQFKAFLDRDVMPNSLKKFLFSFISVKMFLEHHRNWQP